MKRIFCIATIVIVGSFAAFADIARPGKSPNRVPKPNPGVDTTMTIKLDRNATEARLIIPKSQVKQLRAELEQLDDESGNTASAGVGFSRLQTIASGLFLSLAFIFGGIWFARSGNTSGKNGKTIVVLAIIAGLGSAATFVYANVGPPPEARSITNKLFDHKVFSPYGFASGKIKIETSNDTTVQLIVPDTSATPSAEE